MVNKEALYRNYNQQKKSRTTRHSSYPERFFVPEDYIPWEFIFPEYKPALFTSPIVLDPGTPWADPEDINKKKTALESLEGALTFDNKGYPRNPKGRTGIERRGVLGKWGPNLAADGIITTFNPQNNSFLLLVIVRSDNGEFAFPGGMTDPGETPFETRDRELEEELSIKPDIFKNSNYDQLVFQGFVDDPRNTDNSWMETSAIHTHFSYSIILDIQIKAGDDAKEFQWVDLQTVSFEDFYACHGYILIIALEKFMESEFVKGEQSILNAIKQIFG